MPQIINLHLRHDKLHDCYVKCNVFQNHFRVLTDLYFLVFFFFYLMIEQEDRNAGELDASTKRKT